MKTLCQTYESDTAFRDAKEETFSLFTNARLNLWNLNLNFMPRPPFPLQLVPAIRAYLSEQEVLLSLPLSLLPLFLLLGIRRLLLDDQPT